MRDLHILKQWIALKVRSDWLVKLRISFAIYLRATREKNGVLVCIRRSKEITQINFFDVYIISLF